MASKSRQLGGIMAENKPSLESDLIRLASKILFINIEVESLFRAPLIRCFTVREDSAIFITYEIPVYTMNPSFIRPFHNYRDPYHYDELSAVGSQEVAKRIHTQFGTQQVTREKSAVFYRDRNGYAAEPYSFQTHMLYSRLFERVSVHLLSELDEDGRIHNSTGWNLSLVLHRLNGIIEHYSKPWEQIGAL
jgi:hypothetical protein